MSEFPKWKHHATLNPIIVQNAEQEAKLSPAWKDSPADHGKITAPSVQQMQEAELGFDPFAEDNGAGGEAEVELSINDPAATPRRRR